MNNMLYYIAYFPCFIFNRKYKLVKLLSITGLNSILFLQFFSKLLIILSLDLTLNANIFTPPFGRIKLKLQFRCISARHGNINCTIKEIMITSRDWYIKSFLEVSKNDAYFKYKKFGMFHRNQNYRTICNYI